MKIGPVNTILEPVKMGKVSTKTYVVKTVPASYTLPLQTVPDPFSSFPSQNSSGQNFVQCDPYCHYKHSYFFHKRKADIRTTSCGSFRPGGLKNLPKISNFSHLTWHTVSNTDLFKVTCLFCEKYWNKIGENLLCWSNFDEKIAFNWNNPDMNTFRHWTPKKMKKFYMKTPEWERVPDAVQ